MKKVEKKIGHEVYKGIRKPIAPPTKSFKDASRYTRKAKHKRPE
jgi:hypothetical protein